VLEALFFLRLHRYNKYITKHVKQTP